MPIRFIAGSAFETKNPDCLSHNAHVSRRTASREFLSKNRSLSSADHFVTDTLFVARGRRAASRNDKRSFGAIEVANCCLHSRASQRHDETAHKQPLAADSSDLSMAEAELGEAVTLPGGREKIRGALTRRAAGQTGRRVHHVFAINS